MLEKMLDEARVSAEISLGFEIPDDVAESILDYAKRKFGLIRQRENLPDTYLALLYENEITDHYLREAINSACSLRKVG